MKPNGNGRNNNQEPRERKNNNHEKHEKHERIFSCGSWLFSLLFVLAIAVVSLTGCEMVEGMFHPYGAPGTPDSVRAEATGAGNRITWDAVKGAESYNIYYSEPPGAPFKKAGTASGTTYIHSKDPDGPGGILKPLTTYAYCVTAVNENKTRRDEESSASWPDASATSLTLPDDIDSLGTVGEFSATSTSITFTWSPVPGAASYNIYCEEDVPEPTLTLIGTSQTPAFTHRGLPRFTRYWYYVQGVNIWGSASDTKEKMYLSDYWTLP